MSDLDSLLAQRKRRDEIQEQVQETSAFSVGELLLIRGCFFRITALTEGKMYLSHVGNAAQMLKKL